MPPLKRLCARLLRLFCFVGLAPKADADLIINEIMQNPSAVSDANGEWLEIFNDGLTSVDIDGWTIRDDDSDSHVINNGGALLVPAGGYLVLGRNSDSGANGGVTVGYQYSSFVLANGADEVVLLDDSVTPVEIDRVNYDGGTNFPDPTGASMELNSPSLDNNVGANWSAATTAFGDGDLGTPGAANSTIPEPGTAGLLGLALVGLGIFRRRK